MSVKVKLGDMMEDCPIIWQNFIKNLKDEYPDAWNRELTHEPADTLINKTLNDLYSATEYCDGIIFDTEEDFIMFKLKFS